MRTKISPELRAERDAVAALPDDRINTNDIPEAHDWSGATRGRFHPHRTQRLELAIDADVVALFRSRSGEGGWQHAGDRALRASMLRNLRRRA